MGKPEFPPQGVGIPVFACMTLPFSGAKVSQTSSLGGQPRRQSLRDYFYFRNSKSAAMKRTKTTEMTPFMVKKAALSLERSSGFTRERSYKRSRATAIT